MALAALVVTAPLSRGEDPRSAAASLPPRVREIVVHVPGGPSYRNPSRRFRFFTPTETQALWKPRFGAHWIVWTDGSLWPRHHAPGEPASFRPPVDREADDLWRRRLSQTIEGVGDEFITVHDRPSSHRQVEVRQLAHSVESSLSGATDGRDAPR